LRATSLEASKEFWRDVFGDFREPTALPADRPDVSDGHDRFASHRITVTPAPANMLRTAARPLQVTPNSLVQGAWALLLSRQSESSDVVFGSAFSGRPTDLDGAESIVGPFVNVLPLRVTVDSQLPADRFFQQVHAALLTLNAHQFTPLAEIQNYAKVSERRRLFESLVVFQNYLIDDAAKSFGKRVQISDFVGPIHTNYPLLLLVEPHAGMQLTLMYDTNMFVRSTIERWGRDLAKLLEHLDSRLERRVIDLQEVLSVRVHESRHAQTERQNQNFVPAQSQSEHAIAAVWSEMFGLDRVSVEENFFDLGGQSLLLVRMHRRLQESLYPDLSIVTIFEHPTVRSLAHHLDQSRGTSQGTAAGESQNRARQQKQA